jgi:hypothetical protein
MAHVLAQHDDATVTLHFHVQAVVDGLDDIHLGHVRDPLVGRGTVLGHLARPWAAGPARDYARLAKESRGLRKGTKLPVYTDPRRETAGDAITDSR